MTTILEAINIALRRVGVGSILSLSDGTEQAQSAGELFPIVRDSILRDHTWKFAKKQSALTQYATSPTYDYTFAYLLPVDCLFVVSAKDRARFNILNINDQKVLVSDDAGVMITYRARVENPALWDPLFVSAFVSKLASEFALSLVKNYKLHEALMLEYLKVIDAAISTDSIEEAELRIISPDDLLLVRGYSWSGKKVMF